MGGVKVKIQKLKNRVKAKAENQSDEDDPLEDEVRELMDDDAKGKNSKS